jgi:hypothetical protein
MGEGGSEVSAAVDAPGGTRLEDDDVTALGLIRKRSGWLPGRCCAMFLMRAMSAAAD